MSTVLSRQCRALRQWLPEYAEEKLSGRRRAAVAEHLAGCARCSEEVAELRAMLASLHAVGQEAVPAHLLAAVRASLREPAAARPASSLWVRLAVPIAAATGLVAIAFALHQPATPRQAAKPWSPAAQTEPAGPARRATAPVIEPRPVAGRMAPQAASGGRRVGPALPRHQVMGRGPAPTVARGRWAAPKREAEEKKAGEEARDEAILAAPAGVVERDDATAAAQTAAPATVPATAGGGGGGVGGGGGGRGGGGAKDITPPSAQRPAWRATRPGRYPRRYGGGGYPERRRVGRIAGAERELGVTPPAVARLQSAARPPANAFFAQTDRGQAIALHLEPSMGRKVKVYAGNQVISPSGESRDQVVLPAGSMGNSPSQVAITISSEAGDWKYTLFTPGANQVGKQQSTAVRHYQLEPLARVLADLSAESGLVLLVEGNTDTKVEGALPLVSPQDAVARLAEAAKLDAYTEDGTVYTLRPRR